MSFVFRILALLILAAPFAIASGSASAESDSDGGAKPTLNGIKILNRDSSSTGKSNKRNSNNGKSKPKPKSSARKSDGKGRKKPIADPYAPAKRPKARKATAAKKKDRTAPAKKRANATKNKRPNAKAERRPQTKRQTARTPKPKRDTDRNRRRSSRSADSDPWRTRRTDRNDRWREAGRDRRYYDDDPPIDGWDARPGYDDEYFDPEELGEPLPSRGRYSDYARRWEGRPARRSNRSRSNPRRHCRRLTLACEEGIRWACRRWVEACG
ncbi:MAG: hypothetical protein AAGC70_03385 [Pseudomonadota bacterium]